MCGQAKPDPQSGHRFEGVPTISYPIPKDGNEPIAENNDISVSDKFDVEIEESGAVTGEKAKGCVRFIVESVE